MTSAPITVAALAGLFLAPMVSAQESEARTTTSSPGIYRFVPSDASIVLRTSGPSGFGRTLASTNLYQFLQTDEMQAELDRVGDRIIDLVGETGAPAEMVDWMHGLVETLGAYPGDLVLGARLGEGFAKAVEEDDPGLILETAQVFLSMTPAEGFDAQAFVDRLMAPLLEQGLPPTESLEVGPGFQSLGLPFVDGVSVVLPRVVDGGVVMAFGAGLEQSLASIYEGRSFDATKIGPSDARSAMSFYFDLTGVSAFTEAALLRELSSMPEHMVAEEREKADLGLAVMRELGLGDLESMSGTIGGLGDFIESRVDVRFHGKAQRLFDLLRVEQDQRLRLLDLIPRDATSGSVGYINIEAAANLAFELAEQLGAPVGREEIEGQLRDALGIDLQADVLDQLTGEFSVIEQYGLEEMQDADFVGGLVPFDMTLGVGIADSARFADLVDGWMELAGMKPEIAETEYGGTTVHTLSLGFFDLEYAFLPEGAVVSFGNFEESRLSALIDRSNAIAEGEADTAWPEALQKRIDVIGPFDGIQVSQVGDLSGSFEKIFEGMSEGLAMDPNTPPPARILFESLFGLASKLLGSADEAGIGSSVSTSRVGDGVLTIRVIQ